MQLQYKSLVNERQFIYVPLKSPKTTRTCALCPTTIRAAEAAGNMPMYAAGARLTSAITTMGFCTAWDATKACCSAEGAGRNGGDVDYIKQVIRSVSAALRVDAQRVYIVGIANGGFMAQRMACEEPSLFAGVVAYASGIEATRCTAAARVPVLLIHGTVDVIVPFAGGFNFANVSFPGFVETSVGWAARNGCAATPELSSFSAQGGPRDTPLAVQIATYAACTAKFATWRIQEGQHFALAGTSAVIFQKALQWVMAA
jgi:poly(3-hydroxybutyrate) depolymerase